MSLAIVRVSSASWYVLRDTWLVRPGFSLYFRILTNGCMTSEIRGLSCVLTYSPLVFVSSCQCLPLLDSAERQSWLYNVNSRLFSFLLLTNTPSPSNSLSILL